jgi:predicted nucleic-acid-binding Zn-ribbon protein
MSKPGDPSADEPRPQPAETRRERKAAQDHLARVWTETESKSCPICGHTDWAINDVAELPVRNTRWFGLAGPDDEPGRAFPLVPVNCINCGYTFFINEKWVRIPDWAEAVKKVHAEMQRESDEG